MPSPEVEQAVDVARGVFDGVDAAVGLRAVALQPGELGRVFVAALVAFDDAHAGRLANEGDRRADAGPRDLADERLRAEAADLLVIGEGEMQRPLQIERGVARRHGKAGGDETLHVAGTAAVEPAVALDHAERVRRPVLPLDRHNVGMAGQDDAAVAGRAERSEEVGLGAGPVAVDRDRCAGVAEKVCRIGDQVEIARRRDGRERDQVAENLARAGEADHE